MYLALRYLDDVKADKGTRNLVFHEIQPSDVDFVERDQQNLRLAFQGGILTTPHILTEVLKLRKSSWLRSKQFQFRELALGLLSTRHIEEVTCPVVDIIASLPWFICQFGLADASGLFAAQIRQAILITDDNRLFAGLPANPAFEIRLLSEFLAE